MKLEVQSIHFTADKKLLDFVQKKADKLETFYERVIGGEVILKLENDSSRENKVIEMKIFIPGSMLFAKEQAKTFEEATDMVVEALKKQLHKHKDKQLAH